MLKTKHFNLPQINNCMKRKLLLLSMSFGFLFLAFSLQAQVNCGSAEAMQSFYEQHPDQAAAWRAFNQNTNNSRDEHCNKHYVIPVVFHVFNSGGANAITPAQIQSALDRANEDFNGLNGDFNSVDPAFQDIRGTIKVTFALATIDPDGNATTGITYHSTRSGFGNGSGYNDEISSFAWDNYKYLNVYIMRDLYADGENTNSGVAWYPDSWMSDNGLARIVYNDWYLGDTGSSIADAEFQSVFTHEIGHWLNLAHTFDTGCSGNGDGVEDTPTTNGSAGCGPNAMSCGHITNGENYMDYNSDCYKMFTQGQIDRMVNTLENHPSRFPIWQLSNLEATGTLDHYDYNEPIADFSASAIYVDAGQTVFFNDESCGFPDTWQWTFEGGQPASSSEQNPYASFAEAGEYTVSLVASNDSGSSTYEITIYVETDPLNCAIGYTFEEDEVNALPDGWTVVAAEEGLTWEVAEDVFHNWTEVDPFTSTGHNSLRSLYCPENWVSNIGPIEIMLVSPPIDLSNMTDPKLSYSTLRGWDAFWPEVKPDHEIEMLAGESADGPWFTVSFDIINQDQFHDWVEFSDIYLGQYAGQTIHLAFRTNTHHYYWRIDDICIRDGDVSNNEDLLAADPFTAFVSGNTLYTNSNQFEVYNVMGQRLFVQEGKQTADMSALSTGVYMIVNNDHKLGTRSIKKVFKH